MEINGIKVVDAKKPLKLHITTGDVKKGANKNPGSCAAAQACLKLPGVTQARVHISKTYIQVGNRWMRFDTPKSLRSEIIAFDRGGKFAAGEYTLKPVIPAHKPTGKSQGTATSQSRPYGSKKKKRAYHVVKGLRKHGAAR